MQKNTPYGVQLIPAAGVEPARPCGHWILSSITPLFKSYNLDLIGL